MDVTYNTKTLSGFFKKPVSKACTHGSASGHQLLIKKFQKVANALFCCRGKYNVLFLL
jgi:hypothetical protein